ncbi:MAG: hypothetical protein M5U28_52600 [Sandaracinaceae bacterium]|nr:hypothetical protein [Sandaracinaceae bacterium]
MTLVDTTGSPRKRGRSYDGAPREELAEQTRERLLDVITTGRARERKKASAP